MLDLDRIDVDEIATALADQTLAVHRQLPSAGRVLVVIAYRDLDGDLHGINAWPATGADLKLCQQRDDDGQDD